MLGTKCPTVRSRGTTRMRSALMPILMISRASMGFSPSFRGVRSANPESRDSPMRNCASEVWSFGPSRNDNAAAVGRCLSLLRSRGALHKSLAALHLVGQRRFVDLDHDVVGVNAEVLHQRLRDVAHHADLLFLGAASGHADGDFGHFCHSYSLFFSSWPGLSRPSTIFSIKQDVDARHKAGHDEPLPRHLTSPKY